MPRIGQEVKHLECELLLLPDLVQSKRIQRDRDWPRIRRLLEAHCFQNQIEPKPAQVRFWFRELRTPELLVELACRCRATCRRIAKELLLLAHV